MELVTGIEPASTCLQDKCSANVSFTSSCVRDVVREVTTKASINRKPCYSQVLRRILMHKRLLSLSLLASLLPLYGATLTLTWTDLLNPPSTTYNVKEAQGLCTGTPTFATIASGVAVKTFVKTNPGIGAKCYIVTAVFSGIESAPSNQAGATIAPAEPTTLNVVIADLKVRQVFIIPSGTLKRLHLTLKGLNDFRPLAA